MAIKKGTRVRYKAGSGHAVGKVTQVRDGRAVIDTGNGTTVTRKVENLSNPDKDDESPAPKAPQGVFTVASDQVSGPYPDARNLDIDDDEDGEDTELEGCDDDE